MARTRAPHVLSIAGCDPSGGAGVLADIKTFSAHGCYGMGVVTALTVQNTQGVFRVAPVAPELVVAQIEALFADIEIDAVKIGMLATPQIAQAVAQALARAKAGNIVLDPVLAATQGAALGGAGLPEAIMGFLLPLAAVVTPNLFEAAALTKTAQAQDTEGMARQAGALVSYGAQAALVKGGHLDGDPFDVFCDAQGVGQFHGRRIETRNTHGTGCALSAAIAARLAQGESLVEAVALSKTWLEEALMAGDDLQLGNGQGPPHHFKGVWRDS
jgi:hydroxymethylpyrimidine/phosphomethylpyrimidine kinase